jgi:transposase
VRCGGWEKNDPEEPADHALGRSRGGFSTKIHLLCDGHGHPLHFHLTPGQDHESTALELLLAGADEQIVDHDDERVTWPVQLAGDKAYRAEWIDQFLLDLEIQPVIPSKENEDRNDRAIEFDREAYRARNIIERLIGWLKESRRIFSRFEKTAKNFGGMIKLAFIRRYLRLMC